MKKKHALRSEINRYTGARLSQIWNMLEDEEEEAFIQASLELSISLRSIKDTYSDFEEMAIMFFPKINYYL